MNYFAHGLQFLERPYFLAGAAVPDWLSLADRRVRVRGRNAEPLVRDPDPRIADVAAGILQHLYDDRWFHQTRAFAELSLEFTAAARRALAGDDGFRPSFLGHILVEILLDAILIERHPRELEAYYAALQSVDPELVGAAVNRIASRPSQRLPQMIRRFLAVRFLYDYADDEKLLCRLNGLMSRLGLPQLPRHVLEILPPARAAVRRRSDELLAGDPTAGAVPHLRGDQP